MLSDLPADGGAHFTASHQIVLALAQRKGIEMDRQELLSMANTWERRHRGFSGRVAQQFIHYLESLPQE